MTSPKLTLLKPILGDELTHLILENLKSELLKVKGFSTDRSYKRASINVTATVIVDNGRELEARFRVDVVTHEPADEPTD